MKKQVKLISWAKGLVQVPGINPRQYHTETAFQIYCATWIRKTYPKLKFHHSANEREGGKSGLIAKLMGQSKGFPDFYCPRLKLALELKIEGRKASAEQIEWLNEFKKCGYFVEVVYSFERFKEIVLESVQNLNS